MPVKTWVMTIVLAWKHINKTGNFMLVHVALTSVHNYTKVVWYKIYIYNYTKAHRRETCTLESWLEHS